VTMLTKAIGTVLHLGQSRIDLLQQVMQVLRMRGSFYRVMELIAAL
jgi:hypothetical protein